MKVAVQFLGTIRKRLENCCLSVKFFNLFDFFEEKTEEDDIYIYIYKLWSDTSSLEIWNIFLIWCITFLPDHNYTRKVFLFRANFPNGTLHTRVIHLYSKPTCLFLPYFLVPTFNLRHRYIIIIIIMLAKNSSYHSSDTCCHWTEGSKIECSCWLQ